MARVPARAKSGDWTEKGSTAAPTGPQRSGSTFDLVYGVRQLKAYPITDGELGKIFGISAISTICFSGAAALFGFFVDVSKDLALAPETPVGIRAFWDAARTMSIWVSVPLVIIGIGLIIWRQTVVSEIKRETKFPGGADGSR